MNSLTTSKYDWHKSTQILARVWLVLLCVVMIMNIALVSVQGATNTLDQVIDKLASIGEDTLPDWDTMSDFLADPEQQADVQSDPDEKYAAQVKKEVYTKLMATYGTKNKYEQFRKEFEEVAEVVDGSIQKNEDLKGDSGQKRFEKLMNGFNKSVGEAAVGNTAEKLFGTDNFDPDNNFLSPVMDWVYYIVNTLFSVCSQCVIWFMLGQAGADVLYIGVDWTRAFLTPYKEENRNAAAGADGKKKFVLPIISDEAYRSVHGGGMGAGSGDSAIGSKKVMTYLKTKTPVIILGATYLVMVAAGWWPRLIGIVSGVVITVFTYVLTFLGLM